MTQEEIIELARQAGMGYDEKPDVYIANIDDLQDFAKLIAEKEREACANICERTKADVITGNAVEAFNYATKYLANLIRAKEQA